jgi:hypothetical protein
LRATLSVTMARRPVSRLFTAFLVVLSLLFSELALANYVCPTGMVGEEVAMEMAPGEPCEGMASDRDQPVLCYQHCANVPQSFDPVQVPAVSLPAVVLVLLVPAVLDNEATESAVMADAGQARPPPDPLFLSTLRLRV